MIESNIEKGVPPFLENFMNKKRVANTTLFYNYSK